MKPKANHPWRDRSWSRLVRIEQAIASRREPSPDRAIDAMTSEEQRQEMRRLVERARARMAVGEVPVRTPAEQADLERSQATLRALVEGARERCGQ